MRGGLQQLPTALLLEVKVKLKGGMLSITAELYRVEAEVVLILVWTAVNVHS